MKLKFELVNGYGVLVDEESDPYLLPTGKTVLHIEDNHKGFRKIEKDTILGFILSGKKIYWEVLFAKKELNLEGVPTFEWRDFEAEELALKKYRNIPESEIMEYAQKLRREAFIQGYKSNPEKYTEGDIENAIETTAEWLGSSDRFKGIQDSKTLLKHFLESLQKYPKYVVMESEVIKGYTEDGLDYIEKYEPKLFINSEGKQQGTVKELIWD